MSYNIISGSTQVYYHTIPSDLDTISTTPTQQAIFQYLSQIGYDKFPEFIKDILVKIHGHQLVDITDGPGDEKQDILTITPSGKRCLIQCKHTQDYNSKYVGDELDSFVVACLRKNCRVGYFVTNGDLTPPAKKFVTDNEYLKGWPDPSDPIVIDYLNGIKIWDSIKDNTDILHKWFGGLGQTHGLKSFKFDITVQMLPNNKQLSEDNFDSVVGMLVQKHLLNEITKDLHYQGVINGGIEVNVKRWFQFSGSLDINYIPAGDECDFVHKPMYALAIEVILHEGKYSPNDIRQRVISFLFDSVLTNLGDKSWWHIVSSQSTSFTFLHDISEPRQLVLDSAETFIKVKDSIVRSELSYCSLDKSLFIQGRKDDDTIWTHKETGMQVMQFFDQRINPIDHYNYQVVQHARIATLKSFIFRAVENVHPSIMMRLRNMLPPDWVAFQSNANTLLWCFPPETKQRLLDFTEKKIKHLGVTIKLVHEEDKGLILNSLPNDLPPATFHIHADLSRLSFPIDLNSRIFWIMKEIELKTEVNLEQAIDLLKLKLQYEDQNGFQNLMGESEIQLNSSELPNLLLNLATFRGNRMIDIAILDNPITINLRFKENSLLSSNDLAITYINEAKAVLDSVRRIVEAK